MDMGIFEGVATIDLEKYPDYLAHYSEVGFVYLEDASDSLGISAPGADIDSVIVLSPKGM